MYSPVSTQSVGFNQPFACHSNSNEEGKEIINQDSNDGEALINQLITVVAHHSSPPWRPGSKPNFLEHSFG